jgi:ABC-type nickel/cobalt efflux system permease component RcnA
MADAHTTTLHGPAAAPPAHAHHDHGHAHDHAHDHHHAPAAPRRAPAVRSLLALSGLQRLMLTAPVIAGLWLLMLWAIR